MTTASTTLLGLALPVTGELSGTWGDVVNASLTNLLDTAIAGTTTLSSDADVTLSTTTLSANQARQAVILWTAGGTVTRTITAPAQSKPYIIINKTSSSQSIKIVGVGPTTGVTIVAGTAALVAWNGVDFVTVSVTSTTGILPVANGGTGLASGTSGGVLAYTATGTLASSAALAASALVLGGGAGAAPATTTTGTGVVTALGVNTGTAGAFVVNGGALGSPSSAGTIPAFTLGGTVAGGGNQLNNVIIGTTTPLAGAFTTLTLTSDTPAQFLQYGLVSASYQQYNTFYAFRGTRASPTQVLSGDVMALNGVYAYDNTATLRLQGFTGWKTTAAITGVNQSAWSVMNNAGTDIISVSSTGLAVTGTLSATGQILSNGSGGNISGISTYTNTLALAGSSTSATTSAGIQFGDNFNASCRQWGIYNGRNSSGQSVGTLNFVVSSGVNADALANTIMTLDSSGNLGIGTSSPFTRLESAAARATTLNSIASFNTMAASVTDTTAFAVGVGGGINFRAQLTASTYSTYASIWSFRENATTNDYRGSLIFGTSDNGDGYPEERARIDSSGNLLVGATSQPVGTSRAVFSTTGNTQAAIFINDTFNYSSTINWNKATANNNYFVEFATEGTYTARGSITYNRAGGLTVYSTTSDYRLKEHIIDLPNALETVSRLKPRQFDWKETGNTTTGFIAHELAEVCPHAVTGEKDATEMRQYEISPAVPATQDEEGNELTAAVEAVMGEREVPRYQGIDTSFLVATLTAAIQEQQAIITALTTRITALEAK